MAYSHLHGCTSRARSEERLWSYGGRLIGRPTQGEVSTAARTREIALHFSHGTEQGRALHHHAHLFVPTKAVLVVIKVEVLLQSKESSYKEQTRHRSLVPPLLVCFILSLRPSQRPFLAFPIHPKLHWFLLLSAVSFRTTGAPSCPSQFLCQDFFYCCCTARSLYS
jgi:hypothetical protein